MYNQPWFIGKYVADVKSGRIEIVSRNVLFDMGIQTLFERYKREYEYLFDRGELYALAMAKAMGLAAFISDDTKEFGPHESLVKVLFPRITVEHDKMGGVPCIRGLRIWSGSEGNIK